MVVGFGFLSVLLWLLSLAVMCFVLYWVIRLAVRHALRDSQAGQSWPPSPYPGPPQPGPQQYPPPQ